MCHCVVSLTAHCLLRHFTLFPIFLSLVITAVKYVPWDPATIAGELGRFLMQQDSWINNEKIKNIK